MPVTQTANLNDLMVSYFSRAGQILNVTLAEGVNATGPATPVPVTDLEPHEAVGLVVSGRFYHQVLVSGTFEATINFEASIDGETFYPLVPILTPNGPGTSPNITQPGFYLFQGLFTDAQINVIDYTSGAINADLRSVLA